MSTDASIKVYEGRTQYNMWKFVLQEQQQTQRCGGGEDEEDRRQTTRTPPVERTGTPNYWN